jgi:hypothetical protein
MCGEWRTVVGRRRLVVAIAGIAAAAGATGSISSVQAAVQQPPVPVVVHHGSDGSTVVGVGNVGVYISPSGDVCPIVSTQDWRCIPAEIG